MAGSIVNYFRKLFWRYVLDRRIFKDRDNVKSSIRRRVDTLLDGLSDNDLIIIEAAAKGIHKAKEQK